MKHPDPLPPHLAGRPFTLDESRAAAIPRSRTRAADLWNPSRGIRVPKGADVDLVDRCRPYTELTGSGVGSHLTAARIHGLYLPHWCADRQSLELTTTGGRAEPRRKNVIGHRLHLAPEDVVRIRGVPVTSIQRTLLDLAQLLALDDLVVVGDQIVCFHERDYRPATIPMVPLDVLKACISTRHGLRGLAKLRAALDLVRVGADSPPETTIRLMIARSTLPTFEPGCELRDATGRSLISPDLACEEFSTCIEYDGAHHRTAEQLARDHDRDFITAQLGWHQVLLNNEDLKAGSEAVVTKIARTLVRGGWSDPDKLADRLLRGSLGTRADFR
ncbi:endonuclease domain-containing protein [Arthrobacter sp. ERGS1:01]|uniref:endonuclease domain-containing protein n=1 Tax=Arthrobacter sp. ERGS1:01 TaxID=1704044 RepID=UPI0009E9BEFE|nr:DUF559 domain-containing protein [Arthrobacter sp. ERGS1:01]